MKFTLKAKVNNQELVRDWESLDDWTRLDELQHWLRGYTGKLSLLAINEQRKGFARQVYDVESELSSWMAPSMFRGFLVDVLSPPWKHDDCDGDYCLQHGKRNEEIE